MLSSQRGDAATADLQAWAQEVSKRADPAVETQVLFEEDSNTFILRLAKDARVLIFRLSASPGLYRRPRNRMRADPAAKN